MDFGLFKGDQDEMPPFVVVKVFFYGVLKKVTIKKKMLSIPFLCSIFAAHSSAAYQPGLLFRIVSFRGQTKLEPSPGWSSLGV